VIAELTADLETFTAVEIYVERAREENVKAMERR